MRTVIQMAPEIPPFDGVLAERGLPALVRERVDVLQVNVGRRCNQACHHCHVDAGPRRKEEMDTRTAERVLELLAASPETGVLDLTGGAPELAAVFRMLVSGARALGRRVIDRCNLTVLHEPGQEDTAEFLAAHDVAVIASLPCYTAENADRQRGRGVFAKSIEALRRLNRLGYAAPGSARTLDLVYNPLGASLPPAQQELERRYREELERGFGVRFDRLLALANMPIARFAEQLQRSGEHARYLELLVGAFNPAAVPGVMCRSLVSVSWRGELYDCDFNQMLALSPGTGPCTVWEIERLSALRERRIATDTHCFGCTAGAGSSCGGALV